LTASTIQEALDVVALSPVEAAIIDLVLPDGNGIELCRSLREWSTMPIIVLSALGEEEQKVRALREGADDYVTKPFGPQELIARLDAVLRRASPEPEESVISVSGLELDLAAHVVRRDGEEIHLTPTEFALLRSLVRNRGRLLTHRDLLVEVWGLEYADEVTVLRGQIANLRRKIEPSSGPRRHYVMTEAGIGYRFAPK
jgi:two-component system KDP operon response regulator KdpE